MDENDLPWTTLAGEEAQATASKCGVRALPTLLLVDQEGVVVAAGHGINGLLPQAEKLLAAKAAEKEKK